MNISSVWSTYAHQFVGTDTPEIDSCLVCGGQWRLIDLGDGRGEYVDRNGGTPDRCSGDNERVHGYERNCEADNGRQCQECANGGTCRRVNHNCDGECC